MYAPGTIGGIWRGAYYYSSDNELHLPPMAFEGRFTVPDEAGTFTGVLSDTGELGDADVRAGVQTGASVHFLKVYRFAPPGYALAPVRYDGTLSPDGNRITGTWEVSIRHLFGLVTREAYGIWEVARVSPERETAD